MATIHVIDYGMGNLASVLNALRAIGAEPEVVDRGARLVDADAIVLPGVGAFPDAMRNLQARDFIDSLGREVMERGKSFLGFCLGMQVICDRGLEHNDTPGLGWIRGVCRPITFSPKEPSLRLPHIGWNEVLIRSHEGLYRGFGDSEAFYFLHSFVVAPEDPTLVSGSCDYGGEVVASVEAGNVWATQFHPEKSHDAGLVLLRNWLEAAANRC